jgi:hypothetical protein
MSNAVFSCRLLTTDAIVSANAVPIRGEAQNFKCSMDADMPYFDITVFRSDKATRDQY